jgi:3-phenylpropionate/trans-cinnamate dioxygenase ferredoxin component
MDFVKALDTSDLPPGRMRVVTVGGRRVLICNVEGSYYAIADRCPHRGASLGRGTLQSGIVTCPRHGSRFDMKTARAISGPRIGPFHLRVKDPQGYAVKVRESDVLIGLP